MKEFFKMMFASMSGCLLTLLVFFIIIFGVFFGLLSKSGGVEIKDKSVLVLDLNKPIVERSSENPFSKFDIASMSAQSSVGLNTILRTIKYAASDDRISGILLDLSNIDAGYATTRAIRNQLATFKASGKFVYAYADTYSQKAYYLATIADKVYLNPEGSVDFKGIYMETMFFKKALEKLEVNIQVVRHGKFKSAVEPYLYEKMSDENRQQLQTFADGIWKQVIKEIAASRKTDTAHLNKAADSLYGVHAHSALSAKLVDKLVYKDELDKELLAKTVETGDIPYISLNDYYLGVKEDMLKASENRIAVIYAFGEITNGKKEYGVISGRHMAKTISEAAEDENIKAIVLRINSPGGDALASDMIWREVYIANKRKPVIVSMGDYAASGGYYIACAASRIFAEPTTLTGSIGVFGVIPNLQPLMNNKLGISFDNVKTNAHSDFISTNHAMSDFDQKTLQATIEDIYSTFIKHVADGRKMKVAEVDSIGQGRIWCGTDALKLGLVDQMGGINDAIEFAAKAAKVDDYNVVDLPVQKDFFSEIMEDLNAETKTEKIILDELGEFASLYEAWKNISTVTGYQARLPYFVIIH